MNKTTKTLLTGVAGIGLLAGAFLLGQQLNQLGSIGSSAIVTLDPTKLANAQRAIAAGLINDGQAGDVTVTLMRLGRETEATIEKVAGAGVTVVVKQAIVAGNVRDITDDVLIELGLPTKVPTVDPVSYLTDVAPTDLSMSARSLMQKSMDEAALKEHNARVKDKKREATEAILP